MRPSRPRWGYPRPSTTRPDPSATTSRRGPDGRLSPIGRPPVIRRERRPFGAVALCRSEVCAIIPRVRQQSSEGVHHGYARTQAQGSSQEGRQPRQKAKRLRALSSSSRMSQASMESRQGPPIIGRRRWSHSNDRQHKRSGGHPPDLFRILGPLPRHSFSASSQFPAASNINPATLSRKRRSGSHHTESLVVADLVVTAMVDGVPQTPQQALGSRRGTKIGP